MAHAHRTLAAVALAALLALAACDSATSPRVDLAGDWAWESNQNPGGSSLNLSLTTTAIAVTGTGLSRGVGPTAVDQSMTVSGEQTRTPPFVIFHLTLAWVGGRVVTYAGEMVGANELRGMWTEGSDSHTLVFYRR
jgi:hypothetical protein